jgi:hypothetical protein
MRTMSTDKRASLAGIAAIVTIKVLAVTVWMTAPGAGQAGLVVPQNFIVDTTSDSAALTGCSPFLDADCSLRGAILNANAADSSVDSISFGIPGTDAGCVATVCTIRPLIDLPTITADFLFVNGYSQTGAMPNTLAQGDNAQIKIVIDMSQAGLEDVAIGLATQGVTMRGLAINGTTGVRAAVNIVGGGNHQIQGNFIGTDASGLVKVGNSGSGVQMMDSPNNLIGGNAPEHRNIISGSIGNEGVDVRGAASTGTQILNNYIGTDATGTQDFGNERSGVLVREGQATVGSPGAGNLISGNGRDGVILGPGSESNTVQSNYIGTDVTGTLPLGNGFFAMGVFEHGVNIDGSDGNLIGGDDPGEGNLISANADAGVQISFNGTNNAIQGNLIGTNAAGAGDMGNVDLGVDVFGAPGNTIGGAGTAGNIISGNDGPGVNISGTVSQNNHVEGNFIGTSANGAFPLGNENWGVIISASNNHLLGNVISANGADGVALFAGSNLSLKGNYIGTNAAGADLGNAGHGVNVDTTTTVPSDVLIGGDNEADGNAIAFNDGAGVFVIGQQITGPPGIQPAGSAVFNPVLGARIQSNSIYSNAGLGIDLIEDPFDTGGQTQNDAGDGDTGANNLQNYPELISAISSSSAIRATLDSTPNTAFRIDFFGSPTCDPSGYGEGREFLGFALVNTDADGVIDFTTVTPDFPSPGEYVTATATNQISEDTSEFSNCVQVQATPSTPSPTPSASPTSTPEPTSTATATPTPTVSATPTPGGSPTPTPTPGQLIWGDNNCSGEVDAVDALLTLRHDAGLSADTGACPEFGDAVPAGGPSFTWGDIDCDDTIGPVDALKLLRFDAGLSVEQPVGCPTIGESP